MKKFLIHSRKHIAQPMLAMLLLCVSFSLSAQQISVRGTVTDEKGDPMPGVTISVQGTSLGTVTAADGKYSLQAPPQAVLVFTSIGYSIQDFALGLADQTLDVVMVENRTVLDDVIVIGYGQVKRRDLTTAVSSVNTKDIAERPIISAAQAIQGRAAGVSVLQPNGKPGGETVIRVRGNTSFNSSSNPMYVVDGVPVDNIDFLAPTDIADIQILKDASSAAIYGSRAASGVVLVTTKAGQIEKNARVTFNAQYGLRKLSHPIQSLNAAQYKELMEEINPGAATSMGTEDITDWYDETYRTGVTQSYQFSVSRSKGDLKYYLSAGYLDEEGIIESAWFNRYSMRANIEDRVFSWLNVGANISYSDNNNNNGIGSGGANRGGVVMAVINLPTSLPVINPTNNFYQRTFYGANMVNPVEAINNGLDDQTKETRLIASGNALITFMPELTLKSTFALDRRNGKTTGFSPVILDIQDIAADYGSAWDTRTDNTVITFDNVLSYIKTFGGVHNLEAMAGSSWTDSYWSQSYINGSHFRSNDIHTLNVANKIAWDNTGSSASDWAIMSYFARAQYNFDSKYYLTASIRADGASRLHPDHRWGTFPSFSAAWRISSEDFMKDLAWLDDMKIRGGWGTTGNQSGLADYAYLQRYGFTRQEWMSTGNSNALGTIQRDNRRTPDLRWETTKQTNVGIDLTILKSRLTFAMDYYYKKTTDMLMTANLGAEGSMQRNGGIMENQGFEFSLNSHNMRGVFNWDTDFNISTNKNKVLSLDLTKTYSYVGNSVGEVSDVFTNTAMVRCEEGLPLSQFYGYISDGVDPETGELMYRDVNRDGKITATDRTYIGDPNPDFIFGLTNTFDYKGLSLRIFLQGSYGNDILNLAKVDYAGMHDLKNQSTEVLNRWRTPGQVTDIPKAKFEILPSSYFVEDGSYLRVKDVTLSYNIKANILKKWGIARCQPYFTATNLLTWTRYTGMDPEVNSWGDANYAQGIDWGGFPQSRSYMFGLNVEF